MNRLYRTAKELLSSDQLNECHDVLSQIIKECSDDDTNGELTRPELADIYNMRGHIKYLWVDFNEAIDDYSQSIRLDPSIAIPYYNRGQIHYRMGG
jgi:tetratricopeptide (TPR) repeat protein